MAEKHGDWHALFPELKEHFSGVGDLLQSVKVVSVPAGKFIFRDGETCEFYLLVLEGSARVQKISSGGQVITLYHIGPGQCCELTTACLLADKSYPANAVAETDVLAALLPKAEFQEALIRSPIFRRAVFTAVDKSIQNLVGLVQEVSFDQMDRRIARYLLQHARNGKRVSITHNKLAEELGTAREVVSRILKEFERNKWVNLHRGNIELIDIDSLRDVAESAFV